MSSIKTALKLLKSPGKMVAPLAQKGFFDWMSDEDYLKLRFWCEMGYKLDLEHPRTFNEKLQWLKLYDKNPLYPKIVDKYRAKEYVASVIGQQYIVPTLGVYERFEDIDFDSLPRQFVLKCTHDSGSIYICRDKSQLDRERAGRVLKHGLKSDPARYAREWPYRQVPRRIIAEKYLEEEGSQELKDYKIFTFSGKAAVIQVHYDRFTQHKCNLYSVNWEYINARFHYPPDPNHIIPRPEKLELMIDLAERLSEGLPHVRVDFYSIDSQIYFGEMTLYHAGGFSKFYSEEWQSILGDLLKLPSVSQEGDFHG